MANKKREEEWKEVKKRCKVGDETVRMAKELGINPKTLIKNIPSKAEKWKAPVDVWIREMYDKVKEKSAKKAKAKAKRLRKESEKLADSSSRLDYSDKSDKQD
ncbi:hypothetical protein [Mesotoga sp. BH458_6_3_2_1]|uniref:hypothetical protein n=1 Tax=Mesotoga sp. BH458_6_3_2_1 TaxID=1437446 RepID=UPI000EF1A8BB|nr:hypothetical protein [Mesotoga sp. BH458_6_3_2_1]RLL82216.1 hypothetical protein Y697_10305 [Mesotoga sp. BH458_6_3_2_1]